MSENHLGSGKRFDEGKLRYDLVPTRAVKEIAKVLTFGAKKYGDRNWEKGMEWGKVIGSLERHLTSWKGGEDFDQESGLSHLSHLITNVAFLIEYSETYPQGDNRQVWFHSKPRIAIDIDEVIADFIGHYTKKFGLDEKSLNNWISDSQMFERLESLYNDEEFWMSIPVKTPASELLFEPVCYITKRMCPVKVTENWLSKHGFPSAPIYSISENESKLKVAITNNIDWFIEDRFDTFLEFHTRSNYKPGEKYVLCWLFDAPHNQKYDVQGKRLKSFKDLPLIVKK